MEERRKKIGDTLYELRPWSVEDGSAWSFRLMKILVSASGGVSAMLERVTPNEWRELTDVCIRYTSIISHDDDGEELVQPLAKRKEHLRGRWADIVALVRAHVEVEFTGFFLQLEVLLAPPGTAEAAPPEAGVE